MLKDVEPWMDHKSCSRQAYMPGQTLFYLSFLERRLVFGRTNTCVFPIVSGSNEVHLGSIILLNYFQPQNCKQLTLSENLASTSCYLMHIRLVFPQVIRSWIRAILNYPTKFRYMLLLLAVVSCLLVENYNFY